MEENPEMHAIDIKEVVSNLLSARHIAKVIYVDEDFDSRGYKNSFMSFVRVNHTDKELPFANDDPEIAIHAFLHWWNNENEESSRMDWIHKLGIKRTGTDTEQRLSLVVDNEMLEFVSPDEFESMNIENGLNENNQILVLMDQELDGYGKGFDYLKKYDNQDYIQCGLFSGKFDKNEEIGKWEELCAYSPCIYPISKRRVTDEDPNAIVEGLRNVLWLRQISDIKDLYSKSISEAFDKFKIYLEQFDPASFDYLVMAKSQKEGCWEFDTLHRIGLLKLNQFIEKDMFENAFETFQGKTSDLRCIRHTDVGSIPKKTEQAKEINQIDLYSDGVFINRTYTQICNGDIFLVDEKYYMLLCQPCNLEIREDGKRNEDSFVYLVPMESHSSSTLKKLKDSMNKFGISSSRVITYGNIEYVLNYKNATIADIRLLDLVSYNKEGKVKSEIDNDAFSQLIQPNMQLRYDILKASFEAVADENAVENEIDAVEAIAIHQGKINNETIDKLNITRVARLKDPRAQECLQELMAYLSRPAYPMDLE